MQNAKLKVVFFGTPPYLDPIIKTLDENFNLIKTIRSTSDSFDSLAHLIPDLFIVASFGKIIPQEILNIPKLGAINIHPSKLPLYRGPSPIQAQILEGVSDSAISFILMDSEMDHGPVIYQEPHIIKPTDTFESLLVSMFGKSAEILPTLIRSLEDKKLNPQPQDDSQATFCQEIKKEDGFFDIKNPPDPQTLDRMIRAYYPWPTAWTRWNGKIVKLLPEGKIQMEGKKAVTMKEFLNGYPSFPTLPIK